MKIRIKKLDGSAVIPHKAHATDAGHDLVAVSRLYDKDGNIVYGTGLALEIPQGYVGLVFPRSSNARTDLLLTNSVGVIDSGYRGEVMLKYRLSNGGMRMYEVGERIGQLIVIPYPDIMFDEVRELSASDRGGGGYGSTGR